MSGPRFTSDGTPPIVRPPNVPIYCCGLPAEAFYDPVLQVWKCARCGSDKVKVAW